MCDKKINKLYKKTHKIFGLKPSSITIGLGIQSSFMFSSSEV